ncbi:hypothetical protein F0562_020022 [Nyssa sinensis]|uniref:histidine kinase n=1 Tax=Nyssa sinensis TaxID=561372 RepID=A0A5J5BQU4_9ASTE|nr:hypothetical protein F0562_020022 [Nyssa sinensis]
MADVEARERKILVAVDEGEESMYALSWCLKNVVSDNSKDTLILLYAKPPRSVYPTLDGTGYLFSSDILASMERYSNEVADCVIEKAKRACKEVKDVKVETRVEYGDPRDVICQMAQELEVDVVVMGSHGYGLIKRAFLGSVAPTLFIALSTIPHLSQVSYIGLDGLSFSFYNDENQTLAIYSNSTFFPTLYAQPVNRSTGKLYGQAVITKPMVTANASSIPEASNRTSPYSLLGTGWNKAQDLLFLNTVAMDGRGVISIGFPAKLVIDHFTRIDFCGGDFHLATNDGQVLVQTKLPDTRIVVNNGTVSLQTMKLNGEFENLVNNQSCKSDDGESNNFQVKIRGIKHIFYCSILDIAGVQSVYVLAFPKKGLESTVHENSKLAFTLVVLVFVIVVVSFFIFISLMLKAARREMFLCAALIKQMESTQQAERKSMNKSLAFASASHDVRASLAAITGLIELCHEDATPDSELASNLVQMNTCTMDLLGILNSVLDTSKIEAGKMQLEEEEFSLAQLVEDVVDMYYPVGMKKGVDVVFDPCDGSILNLHLVKGDRGKLKQILCNLLSNAVKFTSEGHVSVRVMTKKPSKENAIIASTRNSMLGCLSRLCYKKNNGSFSDLDDLHTVQQNPNCMEFVFEVDDTGKGIPKDKQKSVFENFVQVKETALGQGGCGLGLGIVQSLVRLMGGEIKIVDKDPSERGTCFGFNIFLATCDPVSADVDKQDNNPTDFHQQFGLHIRSPASRPEGSHVILLIASEERRRISKKLIENLGIKVSVVKRWRDLSRVLEKIKLKLDLFHISFSEKSELSLNDYLNKSASSNSNSETNDGKDHCKKSNSRGFSSFILIVIDAGAGPYSELCSIVANFRKDIQNSQCKVVWLDNPVTRSREPEENRPTPPCDHHILSKPFHGSHLYKLLGLLPEFGVTYQPNSPRLKIETTQEMQHPCDPSTSNELSSTRLQPGISSPQAKRPLQEIEIHECNELSSERPLSGRRVLVVEDIDLLRKLAVTSLRKLGASVDLCENGKEAFDQVCRVLSDQRREGHSRALPYDYIFMDCEMPVMNGYEATRLIRMEEKNYGIHIPIIALTAHAMAEEARKTIQAGMDFHLTKPLQVDKMLDVIKSIERR